MKYKIRKYETLIIFKNVYVRTFIKCRSSSVVVRFGTKILL